MLSQNEVSAGYFQFWQNRTRCTRIGDVESKADSHLDSTVSKENQMDLID